MCINLLLSPQANEAPLLSICAVDIISYLADDSVVVMVRAHGGRRNVKRAPPDLHLSLSMLGSRLCLVQPCQASVVALVEPPGPMHRHPHLVNAVQDQPQRPNGPLQYGGVANVKFKASICES